MQINLGAKGMVELELISSGEKWGRGPRRDVHSSLKAMVDSPAWHLVAALKTLVSEDGNDPAIEGFTNRVRPLSATEKAMVAEGARRKDEMLQKKQMGVEKWIHDLDWVAAQERLVSQPTVNIEGLVAGYTGPGGKTILPGRAVAKMDLRLVPDMKATEAAEALKAHLAKRGFGDIEVKVTGGYDPNSTAADSALIRAQQSVYKRNGIDPILWPRRRGFVARFRFHRRTAQARRRTFRSRLRHRRARPRRNLPDRIELIRPCKVTMARCNRSSNISTSWRRSEGLTRVVAIVVARFFPAKKIIVPTICVTTTTMMILAANQTRLSTSTIGKMVKMM